MPLALPSCPAEHPSLCRCLTRSCTPYPGLANPAASTVFVFCQLHPGRTIPLRNVTVTGSSHRWSCRRPYPIYPAFRGLRSHDEEWVPIAELVHPTGDRRGTFLRAGSRGPEPRPARQPAPAGVATPHGNSPRARVQCPPPDADRDVATILTKASLDVLRRMSERGDSPRSAGAAHLLRSDRPGRPSGPSRSTFPDGQVMVSSSTWSSLPRPNVIGNSTEER